MEHLNIFSANPYSPALILGLVFFILASVNFEVMLRTKVQYFMWLGWGMLAASLFWGTTELQDVGKLYITWGWWWAQPLFAFCVSTICVGVLQYLPLPHLEKAYLLRLSVYPSALYVTICSLLLALEFQVVRAYAVLALTPPVFALAFAALKSEKIEPKRGHRLIGLLILLLPLLSVAFPIFQLNTGVLRFWTAIPLIVLSISILAVSLLREREELRKHIALLSAADAELARINQDLELRVQDRTAMLQEVISDLESFNRNVSHDIRSPLGSIGLMAFTGKKYLEAGRHEQAGQEFAHIADQVSHAQQMVSTMLSLASRLESRAEHRHVDLNTLAQERVASLVHRLQRKHPQAALPTFTVEPMPAIASDPGLLRIILDNLLENAIAHNPALEHLRVDIGTAILDGRHCLFVRDNGVGLNGADDSLSLMPAKKSQGYGFGLRIVERAIRRLRGDISSSTPAQGGVCFWLYLPALEGQT